MSNISNEMLTALVWADHYNEQLYNQAGITSSLLPQNIWFRGSPCAVYLNNVLNVVVNENNSLYLCFMGPHWTPPQPMNDWTAATGATTIASDPYMIANGNSLFVFAIDPNGNLLLFLGTQTSQPVVYNLSAITPGASGIILTGNPFAISWDATNIAVAARTFDNNNPVIFIVSTTSLLATFSISTNLMLGSDPFLLITGVSQLSLIAEDNTQTQIIHFYGQPRLPQAVKPQPIEGLTGSSHPVQILPITTIPTINYPLQGILASLHGNLLPLIWQIDYHPQAGAVSTQYEFVDPRPSAIVQNGNISVFVIGTKTIGNLESQQLLMLNWDNAVLSGVLTVTNVTQDIGGGAVCYSTDIVIDSSQDVHVFAVTIQGRLNEYILKPGNPLPTLTTLNDRTGAYNFIPPLLPTEIPGPGAPTLINRPFPVFVPQIILQGQSFNNFYLVLSGQYFPPFPTLILTNPNDPSPSPSFLYSANAQPEYLNYYTGCTLYRYGPIKSGSVAAPLIVLFEGQPDGSYTDTVPSGGDYSYFLLNTTCGASSYNQFTLSLNA